jgi:ribA/ribD-fused uncharacterized protein
MPTNKKKKKTPKPSKSPSKPIPTSDTIFFYMPNDTPYGVFCQWYPSTFTVPTAQLLFLAAPSPHHVTPAPSSATVLAPTMTFNCAEQFYMACKAFYFSDAVSLTRILATDSPKEQKKLSRDITGFDGASWARVRARVARVGNWYKFTDPANQGMKDILMGTGTKEVAEAAGRDRVWGIGFSEKEAERNRDVWGENLLGKCLMSVRVRMRESGCAEEGGASWVGREWNGIMGSDEVSATTAEPRDRTSPN